MKIYSPDMPLAMANKTDLRFIDPEFVKEPVPASVIRQTTIPNPNSTVDDTFLGFTYVDAPHIRQNVK
ncbi:hypothetical protein GJ496_004732 [Pomphorhynchus laevis]|nr:hypothetical protein GJ496_004732 [Pomphorhynchus laevis]